MSISSLPARAALALSGLVLATTVQANCFTVHDAAGVLVQQTTEPPVALSLPLGDTVPQRFGHGAHLIFSNDDSDCPVSNAHSTHQSPNTGEAADMAMRAYGLSSEAWMLAAQSGSAWNDGPAAGASGGGYYGRGNGGAQSPTHTGPRGGRYYINRNGNKTYPSSGGGRRR